MKFSLFWVLITLPLGLLAQERIDDKGLKALLNREKVVLLDVRTTQEFTEGHLPGAKLLPFDAVDSGTAAQVIATKTTPVVVYCRSGRRSGIAAQTLKTLGYTRIWDLGAVTNWKGPVETGSPTK